MQRKFLDGVYAHKILNVSASLNTCALSEVQSKINPPVLCSFLFFFLGTSPLVRPSLLLFLFLLRPLSLSLFVRRFVAIEMRTALVQNLNMLRSAHIYVKTLFSFLSYD